MGFRSRTAKNLPLGLLPMVLVAALSTTSAEAGKHKKKNKGKLAVQTTTTSGPGATSSTTAPKAKMDAGKQVQGILLKPGVNLRGKNLSFMDLGGVDLTGADLDDAICIGTRFTGTIMTGASLRRACLHGAEVDGAVGMNLNQARLHPFFEVGEGEPVGDLRFFSPNLKGGDSGMLPNHLVAGLDRNILWLQGDQPRVQLLTATGARRGITTTGNRRMLGLAKDSAERVWFLGDVLVGAMPIHDLATLPIDAVATIKSTFSRFTNPPNAIVQEAKGGILAFQPPDLWMFGVGDGQGVVGHKALEPGWTQPGDRMAMNREGTCQFIFGPDRTTILQVPVGAGAVSAWPLRDGGRVQGMVPGPDHRMWFTQSGPDAIGCLDPKAGTLSILKRLEPDAGGRRTPENIALGADRNLWFTVRGRSSIEQIDLESTALRSFPLPAGTLPGDLLPTEDGRILFTVAGMNLFGSIRTVPGKALGAGAPREEARETVFTPGTERKASPGKADAEEKKTRKVAPAPVKDPEPSATVPERDSETGAEEVPGSSATPMEIKEVPREPSAPEPPRSLILWPDGPGALRQEGVVAEGKGTGEPKAQVKSAAPTVSRPGPDRLAPRLRDLNVHLTGKAMAHILSGHAGDIAHGGAFHPRHGSPEALEALLYRGLSDAGEIARIRSTDHYGRFLTFCESEKVGWYRRHEGGQRFIANRFLVVTTREWWRGAWHYEVITAYPVP